MAVIDPSYQEFFDLPDGKILGVTRFKVVAANNTIIIAPPSRNAQGSAGCQVKDTNDSAVTSHFYIASDGTYRLNNQSAATIGKEVTFISIHPASNGKV